MANRLSGLFRPGAGATVTITLTAALNDPGNIGVYCIANGENRYGAAFVGSRSYTISSTRRLLHLFVAEQPVQTVAGRRRFLHLFALSARG